MRMVRWIGVPVLLVAVAACSDAELPTAVAEVQPVQESRVPKAAASPALVEVALEVNAETGEFSTLIAAVLAADLAGTLSSPGQRTVFAPTDAAFAELGLDAGNIGMLPADALRNILLYHVTQGRRYASSVVDAKQIRMVNGGFTKVRLMDGAAYIDEARIVATDVEASNGIIHVIDAVLLP
jgi:uncharacterized surface protein with fasciclin (FAS1) repeats